MRKLTVVATTAIASALLAACGEDQAAEQQERATRELQQAQRELRKERRRLKRERDTEEPVESSPSGEPSTETTSDGGDTARVPDVEGKDHQLAQDTMQAAGFYNLSEEDASGEDRPLIYDRSWTVVSQSPQPKTRASLDRTIVLKAKKDEE